MKFFILSVILLTSLSLNALAPQLIKAKDCKLYIGKKMTVVGKIKYIAGPGYLTSTSYYLVTDSVEIGIGIIVPMKVMEKSKVLNEKIKGKTMRVFGLIRLNGEPYMEIKKASDVEIII